MFKKKCNLGTYFCSRWACKRGGGGGGGGGLISEIIYSFENGWAYIRGGLKVDFTVFCVQIIKKNSSPQTF